jgi:hypothetical protein
LKHESLSYYRARVRQECEAALNALCPEARRAHAEMAKAYARLVEIAELREVGELSPGKLTSMSEVLHYRDHTEYGGHAPKAGLEDRVSTISDLSGTD